MKKDMKRFFVLAIVALGAVAMLAVPAAANCVYANRELGDPEQFSVYSEYGSAIYWHCSNFAESTGQMKVRVLRDDGAVIIERELVDKGTNRSAARVSASGGRHRIGVSNYWGQNKGRGTLCCPY